MILRKCPCGRSPAPCGICTGKNKDKIAHLPSGLTAGIMRAEQKMKGAQTMELTYRTEGDYRLPNLEVPEAPKIGKYGMLRRSYLQKHRNGYYTGMLLSGRLDPYLEKIDRQATEMVEQLTARMAREQGVTEELKASDQMKWVGLMNNIKASAEEVAMRELVYA